MNQKFVWSTKNCVQTRNLIENQPNRFLSVQWQKSWSCTLRKNAIGLTKSVASGVKKKCQFFFSTRYEKIPRFGDKSNDRFARRIVAWFRNTRKNDPHRVRESRKPREAEEGNGDRAIRRVGVTAKRRDTGEQYNGRWLRAGKKEKESGRGYYFAVSYKYSFPPSRWIRGARASRSRR